MGLLTGFSLISGIEIIYFMIKIFVGLGKVENKEDSKQIKQLAFIKLIMNNKYTITYFYVLKEAETTVQKCIDNILGLQI